MRAGAGAHLHDAIAALHDAAIVLDHEHGVAGLREIAHGIGEARDVGGVEADGRLVEHEERAGEGGAERGGEARALRLAAGERARLAIEREVRETDRRQVAEARRELALHALALRVLGVDGLQALHRLLHGELVPAAEIEAAHEIRASCGVEARAVAGGAGHVVAVTREEDAHVHLVRAALEPLEPRLDARILAAGPVALALDDGGALLVRELLPRHVERDLPLLGELDENAALPLARLARPRLDRALLEGLGLVGDDLVPVDGDDAAEATAVGARAERRVVREEAGARGLEGARAARAHEATGDRHVRGRRFGDGQGSGADLRCVGGAQLGAAVTALPGDLDGLLEAPHVAGAELEAIDDHLDRDVGTASLARLHVVDLAHRAADHEPAVAVDHERLPQLEVRLGALDAHRIADDRAPLAEARHRRDRGIVRGGGDGDCVAVRAGGHRLAGEERGEVRLEVGEGGDGRPARLHRRAPVHRDRGCDRLERADRRALETLQELPRVRAEALDEAPLPFGVERVERERGLAGPARPRQCDELARGEVEIDAAEVVRASSAEADGKHGRTGIVIPVRASNTRRPALCGWARRLRSRGTLS